MEYYATNDKSMLINANKVKEAIVVGMRNECFITNKQAIELLQNYAVIIEEKGWFGSFWDKISGNKEGTKSFVFVKRIVGQKEDADD